MASLNRRRFVRSTSGLALLGASGAWQSALRPVAGEEATLPADAVRFSSDIEPLVRLLEETPRQRVLEEFAHRIKHGLSYREVLATLLLAGVRNVQPRPAVGFKFHAVLVVNSAHLASLAGPDADRWLPIFWALDYFKSAQASDVNEGDWTMAAVDESAVPSAVEAERRFVAAMDSWDEGAADAATAALARHAPANRLFDLFARYGCRDFRSIGHKAIFVANAWRTLNCIGCQYSEPVLRSLSYALLNHTGEPNPAESDLAADAPGRRNAELSREFSTDWIAGKADAGSRHAMTQEIVSALRTASPSDAADAVTAAIASGVGATAAWDAMFVAASELLMRQPGIIGLHTLTTTNALHYAFTQCGDEETRRLLLLQNASFLPMFRERMPERGAVADVKLDELPPVEQQSEIGVEQIFSTVSEDGQQAARQALGYLGANADPMKLIDAARALVFLKGNDSHDYKFSSAVLEDFHHVSPAWRNRTLAAAMVQLPGSGDRDNGLVDRIRDALA